MPDERTVQDTHPADAASPDCLGRINRAIDVEMRLLDWIYRVWLPTSGYLPDDQPCFEAWVGRPFAHGLERFELAIQLPVRPA